MIQIYNLKFYFKFRFKWKENCMHFKTSRKMIFVAVAYKACVGSGTIYFLVQKAKLIAFFV